MTARVLTVTSVKGGVGKTYLSYIAAAGALDWGARVLIVDLDQNGSMTKVLERAARTPHTVLDVITGRVPAREAIAKHPTGIDMLPASRMLEEADPQSDQIRSTILVPLASDYDLIVLDAHNSYKAMRAVCRIAHNIVIPTQLDTLAMQGSVLTMAYCQELNVLDRVAGLAVNQIPARDFLPKDERLLLESLQHDDTHIALATIIHAGLVWRTAVKTGSMPPGLHPRLPDGTTADVVDRSVTALASFDKEAERWAAAAREFGERNAGDRPRQPPPPEGVSIAEVRRYAAEALLWRKSPLARARDLFHEICSRPVPLEPYQEFIEMAYTSELDAIATDAKRYGTEPDLSSVAYQHIAVAAD